MERFLTKHFFLKKLYFGNEKKTDENEVKCQELIVDKLALLFPAVTCYLLPIEQKREEVKQRSEGVWCAAAISPAGDFWGVLSAPKKDRSEIANDFLQVQNREHLSLPISAKILGRCPTQPTTGEMLPQSIFKRRQLDDFIVWKMNTNIWHKLQQNLLIANIFPPMTDWMNRSQKLLTFSKWGSSWIVM